MPSSSSKPWSWRLYRRAIAESRKSAAKACIIDNDIDALSQSSSYLAGPDTFLDLLEGVRLSAPPCNVDRYSVVVFRRTASGQCGILSRSVLLPGRARFWYFQGHQLQPLLESHRPAAVVRVIFRSVGDSKSRLTQDQRVGQRTAVPA